MASSSYFIYFAIIGLVLFHFEIRDCSFLGRHSFPFLSRGVGGRGAVWYFGVIFFHIPAFLWLVPLKPFSVLTAHQQTPKRSTSSLIHCRDFFSATVASALLWLAMDKHGWANWSSGVESSWLSSSRTDRNTRSSCTVIWRQINYSARKWIDSEPYFTRGFKQYGTATEPSLLVTDGRNADRSVTA